MKTKLQLLRLCAAVGGLMLIGGAPARLFAQQTADPVIHIGPRDLGGVVAGANGPEAGV